VNTADDAIAPPRPRALTPADFAEWKSGWRVVVGAATGMGTGIALYLLIASMFIQPIVDEFGWSRGDLGVGGMVSFLVGAVALPLIGRFVDRFGFRIVALVGASGLAATYLAVALQPGAYAFYLALMVAGGIFGGCTSGIVYTRPVIATFERQRGTALGLAAAGTSVMAIMAPQFLSPIIADYGWRAGFYALAALTALIGMPIAIALIGRAKEKHASAADDIDVAHTPKVADVPMREAIRTTRFWLLIAAIACINIPGSGVLGQLAPLVADTGLNAGEVAAVMSIYAIGLLAGRIITGFALDHLPAPLVGAFMTVVPAIGILLLMLPAPSFALAALAVGLIGLQQGSEVDLFAFFISRSFGIKNYSSIYGLIAMAGALSTAIALVLFGKVHDFTGSYQAALIIGGVLFVLGAIAFLCIGAQRRPAA
jgi:MFS family permease